MCNFSERKRQKICLIDTRRAQILLNLDEQTEDILYFQILLFVSAALTLVWKCTPKRYSSAIEALMNANQNLLLTNSHKHICFKSIFSFSLELDEYLKVFLEKQLHEQISYLHLKFNQFNAFTHVFEI